MLAVLAGRSPQFNLNLQSHNTFSVLFSEEWSSEIRYVEGDYWEMYKLSREVPGDSSIWILLLSLHRSHLESRHLHPMNGAPRWVATDTSGQVYTALGSNRAFRCRKNIYKIYGSFPVFSAPKIVFTIPCYLKFFAYFPCFILHIESPRPVY